MHKQKAFMKTIDVTPGEREEIHFLSNDLARKLVVPQAEKKFQGLINKEKLLQLQNNSRGILKEEEKAKIDEKMKRKDKSLFDQEARRTLLKEWDDVRKKKEKSNEIERESEEQIEFVLEKANEMIREQNEEVKEINKLIMSAKVQAIRDAQINEKKIIKKKHAEAETDLEKIMERKRQEGILKDKEMALARKEASHLAALKLEEQIKENNERKLIEEENKIKEGEALLKKMKEDQIRDYEEIKARQLQKKMLSEEFTKENEELRKRKLKIKEQEEKEDKIIAEYLRMQEAYEQAKEAAKKEAKRKREMELSKLKEQHERSSDIQAEQEALRARRAQEEKEREYRRKEKEEVLKRKNMIENLKKSRAEQIEHQEKMRQMIAAQNIEELEMLLKKIKNEVKLEERRKLFTKLENLKHLETLKNQIKEKEVEKINEKKEFYKAGMHLRQEEKRREEMLNVLKKEKLKELQKYNIPEAYINHIRRKVNLEEIK